MSEAYDRLVRWRDVGDVSNTYTAGDAQFGADVRALLAERAAQEWRDISTAPKDGQPIIYQDSDEAVSTCSWQEDDCGSSWWDIAGDQLAYPVRWMPLPPVAVIADHRGT